MVDIKRSRFWWTSSAPDGVAASDEPLVAAAKAQPESFELLYHRYVDRIHGYCLRRLEDREAAEDATSIIFQRAFTKIHACDGRTFRAWLFTIAHNVVTDRHRARRPTVSLDTALSIVDRAPSPPEIVEKADAERRLHEVLNALPADQRRVVELRLAGLTGLEIAHVLGRSQGAVKKLQARAFDKLRVLLEPERTSEGGW